MQKEHYEKIPFTGWGFEEIARHLELTDDDLRNKKILDIGSGRASFAHRMQDKPELASEVVSFDAQYAFEDYRSTPGKMREWRKDMRSHGMLNVAGEAHALPFADGNFDLVISHYAVPLYTDFSDHSEAALKEFEEMLRVLKSGSEMRIYPVVWHEIGKLLETKHPDIHTEFSGDLLKITKA